MLTIIVRSVLKKIVNTIHRSSSMNVCGIDINKTNAFKECDICHYWYFLDKKFKYEPYLCNGCHNLMQKAMNFNDAAIIKNLKQQKILKL